MIGYSEVQESKDRERNISGWEPTPLWVVKFSTLFESLRLID